MVPLTLKQQEYAQHVFMKGSIRTWGWDEALMVIMRPRVSKLSVPLLVMDLSGIKMPQTIQSLRRLYDAVLL